MIAQARQLLPALRAFLALSVVLGLAYPLVVWGVGQAAFPSQANGSMLTRDGRVVGSSLIGQSFTDADGKPLPQYFQSRPSAAGNGYDPTATAASNRGPQDSTDTADRTSLLTEVCTRSRQVGQADGVDGARPHCGPDGRGAPAGAGTGDGAGSPVPPDAVTASGSGVDPHTSPAYAALQVQRVATARGLDAGRVRRLVADHTQGRTLGFLGEPRVNVLELNLALDALR